MLVGRVPYQTRVDTIYLYVHDASVVEPKKKAQGVAAPSPLLVRVQERLKLLNLERQVLALPALSHQKGAGTVDVVAMQERDVHDAIRRARSQGTDWLFHIDDDELLHLTSGKFGKGELAKVVEKARDSTFNLRLDNLEVRRTFPEIKEPYNFFEEETHFKLRVALHADGSSVKKHHDARFYIHGGNPASGADNTTAPFLSYWNGKSGGRLSEPGLKPCGVHFFGSARGDAARNGAQDAADGLVLFHYPVLPLRDVAPQVQCFRCDAAVGLGPLPGGPLKNRGGDGAGRRRRKGHRGIL